MLCGISQPSEGKATVAGYDVATEYEQVKRHIGSVSYTHLDVYKRQKLSFRVNRMNLFVIPMAIQEKYAVSIDYQILADNTIEKSCAFD